MRVALMALLVLPLTLIAAVCVTDVRQRGDTGPWVGEITNYGPDTVGYAYVEGRVLDALNAEVAYLQTTPCPTTLRPGESAAFELQQVDTRVLISEELARFRRPFRLEGGPILHAQSIPRDQEPYSPIRRGLVAAVSRTEPAKQFLLAEIQNSSPFTYRQTTACAVVRSASGEVLAVGAGRAVPNAVRGGDAAVIPIFFQHSIPPGDIEVFAEGLVYGGCCTVEVPPENALDIAVARIVDQPDGRHLWVAGEVQNTSDRDLNSYSLTAHLDDEWAERVDGALLGCDGLLGRDDTVPFIMSFPVASTRTDRAITIEGIEAYESGPFYKLPVSGVSLGAVNEQAGFPVPTRPVTVTLRNDTDTLMSLGNMCVGLLDSSGRTVGAGYFILGTSLAPGTSLTFTYPVQQLAPSASATVVAYAVPFLDPPLP